MNSIRLHFRGRCQCCLKSILQFPIQKNPQTPKHTLEMESSQYLKEMQPNYKDTSNTDPKTKHSCYGPWVLLSGSLSLVYECMNYLTET